MHPLRTTAAVALAAACTSVASPAHAADAYRYWGYYHLTGHTWAFATKGLAETVPADGAVEGLRYAVGDGTTPRLPRAVATFDEICAAAPAKAGAKRVGVVVDFGRVADARDASTTVPKPYSRCASVPTGASAQQVLAAVAKTRIEAAMLCGIDGYPTTGCSDTVKTLSPEAQAEDDAVALAESAAAGGASTAAPIDPSSGLGTAGIVALALTAAVATFALLSRRRRPQD